MNFGTPVPLLIGIILILGALALFFLEKIRPGYQRDSDKVYAVLLMVSGLFLLAHLDMELLASFQQLLMGGMLTALLIESIRSRLPRTEPMQPPLDNRPPRPRYDERPPSRRVYRAELDDRGLPLRDRPYPPQMAPARDSRMAPAREEYRRGYSNDYREEPVRPRQPYEEYRGPAGRLQPSENRPNENRPGENRPRSAAPIDTRYADQGRYEDRPPARPPMGRPPEQFSRPPESGAERAPERGSDFPSRPAARRPAPLADNASENSVTGERPDERGSRDRPTNGERALNVRPYSEAPKLDLSGDENYGDYRPSDRPPGRPEGTPFEP